MKTSEKDFDMFFKNNLDDFEISPPEDIRKRVFSKLSLYVLWNSIKRKGMMSLVFLGIMIAAGVTTNDIFKNHGALKAEEIDQNLAKVIKLNYNKNSIIKQNKNYQKNIAASQNNAPSNILASIPSTQNNINTSGNKTKIIPGKTTDHLKSNSKLSTPIANQQQLISNETSDKIIAQSQKDIPTNNTEKYTFNNEITNNYTPNTIRQSPIALVEPKGLFSVSSPENSESRIINSLSPDKKISFPFIWSFGLNVGHSVIQSPVIGTPATQNDDNYSYSASMNFPSTIFNLDFRAEKRHFFFDFGIQYAHISEKIHSQNMILNPRDEQHINLSGQTVNVDTNGGYYHYYYICDSVIHVLDSIWTWRVDSTMITLYDTSFTKLYDTLKNPSWKNSYTFIEIPFSAGWQYNFGKINIGIKTGPLLSMLIASKGYIPQYLGEDAEMTSLNDEFKKFRFGLSWQVSALASIFLNERMVLECQPYGRFSLSSIKSVSGYNIKNNSFGVIIGIRYFL